MGAGEVTGEGEAVDEERGKVRVEGAAGFEGEGVDLVGEAGVGEDRGGGFEGL